MSIVNKQHLFQLLEKQKLGICTDAEKELLYQWFEQVPAVTELTFVSEEEKEKIRLEISAAVLQKIKAAVPQPQVRKFNVKKIGAVSAAAALLLCFSLFATYYFSQRDTRIAQVEVVAPQGITKMPVTLPDSSQVWLSGGSSVRFPEHFAAGARKVELSGVAFFTVRPDKRAPFTVTTHKNISVRVVGTSFVVDVQKETNHVKVSVITGLVRVDEEQRQLGVLSPGERLSYSCSNKTFFKEKYLPEEVSEWKNDGIIYLNNASLRELVVVLHTIYHVDFSYDDRLAEHSRFNMSFSKDLSIDEVLGMLGTMSGLRFERNKDKISISNK